MSESKRDISSKLVSTDRLLTGIKNEPPIGGSHPKGRRWGPVDDRDVPPSETSPHHQIR